MTTSAKTEIAENLFVKNSVMNLDRASFGLSKSLAGVSWSVEGSSSQEALSHVLGVVFEIIKNRMPHFEIWLLVGTSAWQPNTRIVRHYKLWGALKVRGLDLPADSRLLEEVMIESDVGLKLFGAAKLSSNVAIEKISRLLLNESCTYLAALPRDISPSDLLVGGWSGSLRDDSKVIDFLTESSGLLLKQTGEFEAYERGVVAIGGPAAVELLVS